MRLEVVILAAGKGRRMRSAIPKALHTIGGRPLLSHVLSASQRLNAAAVHVVVDDKDGPVASSARESGHNAVEQRQQKGTGHAVSQALSTVDSAATVLVLNVDVPLVSSDTLKRCVAGIDRGICIVTAQASNPQGLGRILRGKRGEVVSIVEERDANPQQQAICEINSGILCAPAKLLRKYVSALTADNAQAEYYLTDIIEMAHRDGVHIEGVVADDEIEVAGINDRAELARLERHYQWMQAQRLMSEGVTVADPSRIDFRGDVQIGMDSFVDVNCVFEGAVTIGRRATIGPNCHLKDVVIGDDVRVYSHTLIDDATIGNRCHVGPFARIRPGSELDEDVSIGNYVEVKNSKLARGVKSGHLAYLGDAEIGEHVNVGAGAITCNFDGSVKHPTTVGDNVFIGTNATLVAPLAIADGAFIAAGSTITKDVPEGTLGVSRARQRTIEGWTPPRKRE